MLRSSMVVESIPTATGGWLGSAKSGLDIPVAVEDGHGVAGGCSRVGGQIDELDG